MTPNTRMGEGESEQWRKKGASAYMFMPCFAHNFQRAASNCKDTTGTSSDYGYKDGCFFFPAHAVTNMSTQFIFSLVGSSKKHA